MASIGSEEDIKMSEKIAIYLIRRLTDETVRAVDEVFGVGTTAPSAVSMIESVRK